MRKEEKYMKLSPLHKDAYTKQQQEYCEAYAGAEKMFRFILSKYEEVTPSTLCSTLVKADLEFGICHKLNVETTNWAVQSISQSLITHVAGTQKHQHFCKTPHSFTRDVKDDCEIGQIGYSLTIAPRIELLRKILAHIEQNPQPLI